MCGIAGIFHLTTPKPVDPQRIERMCDAIAHRGPDGQGVWTGPGVGLGHRRLSIIDLAGSPQPMASADGRAMLVFNGEIYNYRELRAELRALGATFRTDGDSEVILAAWQRWGPDCLPRLNGMFAFAIYDLDTRSLFLARDRLGVKPLVPRRIAGRQRGVRVRTQGLAGASDAAAGYRPAGDRGLSGVGLCAGHPVHRERSHQAPAGHSLLLETGKTMPPPRCWWDVSFAERRKGSVADLEAELLHLLRQSVTSRMVADVPLGAFLSGGVDSSSVVALMSEASASAVRTCSIGFDVAALDESDHARLVAERFGTEHRSRIVSPDDFEAVDRLAEMFDEPFADGSALPTWRVCQLARESVTVALSGDGADEALGGYRRHVFQRAEDKVRGLVPAAVRSHVFGALGAIYPKADWAPRPLRAKATFQSLAASSESGYARALGFTAPELRQRIYSEAFLKLRADYRAERPLEQLMRDAPARSGLDRAQYADLKFWLPGDILTKVDRTSMSVGLEAREPLLDHKLIEFAASLPETLRIRGGQGKWLMKRTMQRYLPQDILYRPKQGFVTPIAQWFRGPLAGQARAISQSSALARTGWFDARALASVADSHISGSSDHGRLLWQLLMLDRSLTRLFAL